MEDLYIQNNQRIFIVVWIMYIYVCQRFERFLSHHRAKWIDLFPLYIALTRKLKLTPVWKHSIYYSNTWM